MVCEPVNREINHTGKRASWNYFLNETHIFVISNA
jgi:hypothetical protein